MNCEQIYYDVLVIGAGAAGLRAALAAHEAGARVIVMSKRPPGRTGATPSAVFSYCAAVDPKDSPAVHADDTWRSGYYLGNKNLIDVFAEQAPETVKWLENKGMHWDLEDGSFSLGWLAGHTNPRGLHHDHITGRELSRVLSLAVQKAEIEVLPYLWVVDLLKKNGRVVGALAYDWQKGCLLCCQAGAVVLACGGAGQLYAFNTVPKDLTGDGFALAYRAGATLVDMEFVQMYPTVLIWPKRVRGLLLTSGLLLPAGAELLNGRLEPFYDNNNQTPLANATRDEVAIAIAREVLAGRGSTHGGAYLDLGKAPVSLSETSHFKFLKSLGVDLTHERVEVAPGVHFWLGGVATDTQTATDVAGLYAAGEVTGGLHGANRLAGNALPETIVFGAIAGRQAAEYSLGSEKIEDVKMAEVPVWQFFSGSRMHLGRKPRDIMTELQQIMQEDCGVLRERRYLRQASRDLDELAREAQESINIRYSVAKYNNEFCTAIELYHALETARIVVKAAVNRQESRGAHQRLDYPEQYPEGPMNQIVRREGNKPTFSFNRCKDEKNGITINLKSGDMSATIRLDNGTGKTVLELLKCIPEQAGTILHFVDHDCKRGLCGHCKFRINGRVELACRRIIREKELVIEPC